MRMSIVVALLIVATSGCKKDQQNIARGKELLLIDEVRGAVTEFKIATKQEPENKQAKSMLLYANGAQRGDIVALFELGPATKALADEKVRAGLAPEALADLMKVAGGVRQKQYEAGIDTKDMAEFAEVVEGAARFVLESGKKVSELDAAALVLASNGDAKAAAHLCTRLKSEDSAKAETYLVRVGEPAVKCLEALADNLESLGREKALVALALIRIPPLAAALFRESPKLRGFDVLAPDFHVAGGGVERRQDTIIDDLARDRATSGHNFSNDNPKLTLRALWAGKAAAKAFVLLEGFEPDKGRSVVRLFSFENGKFKPAAVRSGDKEVSLDSDGPTLRFRSSPGGQVELVRGLVRDTDITMRGSRLTRPDVGARVVIDRVKSPGVITGVDEFGLVSVRLDTPEGGESSVQVPLNVLWATQQMTVKKRLVEIATMNFTAGGVFSMETPPVVAGGALPRTSEVLGVPADEN